MGWAVSSDKADRDVPQVGAKWRVHADVDNPTIIINRATFAAADVPVIAANGDVPVSADDATIIINRAAFVRADDPVVTGRPSAPDVECGRVVVGDIPQQPPGFQPRADLLAALDRAKAGIAVLYAETGARGVGKTQLAAGFARAKLAAGWRMVAWIDAEGTASTLAGLAAIANAPGWRDHRSWPDPVDGLKALRQRLETDGDRCLIVFDNASDPDELRPYLPSSGDARVLIVSRRRSLTNLGANVPVDVFTAREAQAFLAARTGLADYAGAAAVATELRNLPLALAQAAAVISGQRLTYGTYLARLRAFPVEKHLIPDQPYPPGVAEAVLLSLYEIRASDERGVSNAIMGLLAMLSPSGVDRDMLHAAGQAGLLARSRSRSGVNATLVDQALAVLTKWSLVTVSLDGRTVVAHRLIMRVVRDELARQQRLIAACRAAAATLDGWAEEIEATEDRTAMRDVTRQIKALLENAAKPANEDDGELAPSLLSLRFWALYYLNELGDNVSQAVTLGEPLVADFERMLGSDHPGTLGSRNNLAAAYQAAGQVHMAILLFEQVLAARERLLGTDHPDTLTSRNNLAAAYQAAGQVPLAILLFERTLAARERLQGDDQFSTANSRINLANAYREAGRTADAIPLIERALATWERRLGADHPDTSNARKDLASAYREVGKG
jgi:tetratricopeptide (TPR) repeat protein